MFTIKHIEKDGHESLHEAKTLWRDPVSNDPQAPRPEDRPVYADAGEDHPLQFASGSLYAMNAAGRTVATYHLGYSAPVSAAA